VLVRLFEQRKRVDTRWARREKPQGDDPLASPRKRIDRLLSHDRTGKQGQPDADHGATR
jgi:hypothetical protein